MKIYRPDRELHACAKTIVGVVLSGLSVLLFAFAVVGIVFWVVRTPILFLICKWLAALGLFLLIAFVLYAAVVKPEGT